MWRFWRLLPPHGVTAIFFGSWDSAPILEALAGRLSRANFDHALDLCIDDRHYRSFQGLGVLRQCPPVDRHRHYLCAASQQAIEQRAV